MRKSGLVTLALVGAIASPALAETELADKATGAIYILGAASEGEVSLTSKLDAEMDRYNLTQDCYATHPLYGLAGWKADGEGWSIMLGDVQVVSFDGPPPLDGTACTAQ